MKKDHVFNKKIDRNLLTCGSHPISKKSLSGDGYTSESISND